MKAALDMLMVSGADSMNILEFQVMLKKACNTINDRPLGLRLAKGAEDEDVLVPVTANSLLLGRASNAPVVPFIEEYDGRRIVMRTRFVEQCEMRFWELWHRQVLPDLFPR